MIADPDHSIEEERLISIGTSEGGKILLAVYTETERDGDQVIRLISAREAESDEAAEYLQRRRG